MKTLKRLIKYGNHYGFLDLKKLLYYTGFIGGCLFAIIGNTGCKKEAHSVEQDGPVIIKDTVINSTSSVHEDLLSYNPTKPTVVIFKNNVISAQVTSAHIVIFGSEGSTAGNHMQDGATITGNKIAWTGTSLTDQTGGIVVGYNVNASIEYNYLLNCPYGVSVKSTGFVYTAGGIAYNVYSSSFRVGVCIKGMNNVKVYNNTFYNERTQDVVGSVYITSNFDEPGNQPSTNSQIFNNVFYTKHRVANIYCDQASLSGLQCDYNLYWCEDGEPVFVVAGQLTTMTQWKALGYDQHSVVMNPNFTDMVKFIPSAQLNYGTNLGNEWQNGLDVNTQWNGTDPVVSPQGTTWQVGAYVVK
jgi:hypothetical protein